MPQEKYYPAIYSHRNRSVLPPDLQTNIVTLATAIANKSDLQKHILDFRTGTQHLPAGSIPRASSEIAEFISDDLNNRNWSFFSFIGIRGKAVNRAHLYAMKKSPQIGFLLQFHCSGWVREAALKALDAAPNSPFEFAAAAYRLNDWVENVRNAAFQYANKYFWETDADVVAEAALFLLPQMRYLSRWREREQSLLETTFERVDVVKALEDRLVLASPGHVGRVLQQALRTNSLDPALPRLAQEARQSTVRSTSLEALILKRTKWFTRYEREWVDKIYGRSRRVAVFDERTFEHQLDIEPLLVQGANDRSTLVRKVVATCLIRLRHNASPQMDEIAKRLSQDKSQSVRSRAEYYLSMRETA